MQPPMTEQTRLKPPIPPAAARIAALRNRLNLTNTQAADYLGISVHTYIKWQSGERTPPAVAMRLLDVMGSLETIAPAIHDYFLPKGKP